MGDYLLGQRLPLDAPEVPNDVRTRFQAQYEELQILDELMPETKAEFTESLKLVCQLQEPVEQTSVSAIWLKNGRPIVSQNEPRYQTAFSESLVATLLLVDCGDNEEGEYCCTFQTDSGACVSTSTVVVVENTASSEDLGSVRGLGERRGSSVSLQSQMSSLEVGL